MTDTNTDAAPWIEDKYPSTVSYKGIKRSSQYLTMRDGVKIAIDLYLPKGMQGKVPALIHQTRYYRRIVYTWLLRPYLERADNTLQEIKRLTRAGYAVVNVDVRGSGASFGTRYMEFSPDEIQDGGEVVDWILQQPWSNGNVGTFGTSYTGSTAELLLTNQHPAIKAAAIRYANFDAFTDVIMPGGMRNDVFLRTWSALNSALDHDRLSNHVRQLMGRLKGFAVKGMAAVDEDPKRELLHQAVQEHAGNYDIYQAAKTIEFKDDISNEGMTLDQMSPYTRRESIAATNVPIYSWSGWFDGGFTHAAIKRFLNVKTPGSRLTLGPWDHGGGQVPDPNIPGHESQFDHTGEMLRFFDYYLKGTQTGISTEPPIRYFTMGAGEWKTTENWPPPGYEPRTFYFAPDRKLTPIAPEESGRDSYQVDDSASTGKKTRWMSLVNIAKLQIGYSDREEQDQHLLVYQSQALERSLEVTGHPLVTLFMRVKGEDGQIFAYLEDVTPEGTVIYVTEGQFRLIHRAVSKEKPPYKTLVPYHSFKRGDAKGLAPGEVFQVTFDLLPVSYLFKAGHALRLAIAGADRDNFDPLPEEPTELEVLWGGEWGSKMVLPVKEGV